MNSLIQEIIEGWRGAQSPYSFEIRLRQLINPLQIKNKAPFVEMAFIIDVNGFFLDKEHTKPIKLHRERVIGIDMYNSDPTYANDFKKDLDLFTATTYAEFEQILSSFTTTTYTSDPKFM